MKLIDKSALVAEIDRLRRVRPSDSLQPTEENKLDWLAGKAFCIASLKVFLDTIEMKEVDLEKEIDNYISSNFFGSQTMGFFANRTKEEPNGQDIALCAKHFFELGMQQSKNYNNNEE